MYLVWEYACKTVDWNRIAIDVDGKFLNNLKFADDFVLIADSLPQGLFTASKKIRPMINFLRTKFLTNLVHAKNISVDGKDIEPVTFYRCVGYEIIGRNNQTCELVRRTSLAGAAFGKLCDLFRSSIPMSLKRKMFVSWSVCARYNT